MVTDDEIYGIKRMRASGHTHQEIADSLGLKRSTVAYQLKKLKDEPEATSIEMIHASGFVPKETLIQFDNHGFERHRMKNTLYTTGADIYEMRGGVIHKTSMRKPFIGGDYPNLAPIINQFGRGWYIDIVGFANQLISHSDRWFSRLPWHFQAWSFLELDEFEDFAINHFAEAYEKCLENIPLIPGMIDPSKACDFIKKVRVNQNVPSSEFRVQDTGTNWIKILTYLHQQGNGNEAGDIINKFNNYHIKLDEKFSFENLLNRSGWNHGLLLKPPHYTSSDPNSYWRAREKRNNARVTVSEKMGKRMPRIITEYYKQRGVAKKDIPKLTPESS